MPAPTTTMSGLLVDAADGMMASARLVSVGVECGFGPARMCQNDAKAYWSPEIVMTVWVDMIAEMSRRDVVVGSNTKQLIGEGLGDGSVKDCLEFSA